MPPNIPSAFNRDIIKRTMVPINLDTRQIAPPININSAFDTPYNRPDTSPITLDTHQSPNNPPIGIDNRQVPNRSPQITDYDRMIKTMQQIENPMGVTGKNASGYEGDYQFRYRDENDAGTKYAKQMGKTIDEIRGSKALQRNMMDRYVKDNQISLTRNGYEATPFNTYMAHNQGGTGARYILNNDVALTPAIRRNMMNQNKSIRGNDAQLRSSYIKYMQGKYNLAERQRGYNETRWQ